MPNLNFTPFPVLTTSRLTLMQPSAANSQNIFALRSDPEINKYLDRKPAVTVKDAENFIIVVNENTELNNSVYWAVTITNTNTFVGTICLFDFSTENKSCEIGYELLTKFQGQGIMLEAARAVADYAFQILGVQKILAFSHVENLHSAKLLKKLNFVKSPTADKDNPDLCMFTLYLEN